MFLEQQSGKYINWCVINIMYVSELCINNIFAMLIHGGNDILTFQIQFS